MNLCEMSVEWRDGVLVATLDGEIDMSNAEELRGELLVRLPNDARGLVVDLTGVRYIDSAGIHVAYELGEDLARRALALRLVVPEQSVVKDTLRLAGLDGRTGVRPSVAAALEDVPGATGSDDR